jgi:ABC-type transporter Mla subunit MlaD
MNSRSEDLPAAARQSPDVLSSALAIARGLHQFLNLGVAQLDAALRESDAQVDKIAQCLAALSSDVQQLESRVRSEPGAMCADLAASLRDSLQSAVKALQFYDKLIQRLTHVRAGLAIPADATTDPAAPALIDWNSILDQVRGRYSMVEERVLFDFMMRGLRAEQMLKALQSLRDASAPGELELF